MFIPIAGQDKSRILGRGLRWTDGVGHRFVAMSDLVHICFH